MSWLNTLASVAKTVGKTLSDITEGLSDSSDNFGASLAQPYWNRPGTSRTNDSESQVEAAAAARITTRARRTYELDRFQKNALLMFVQNKSDVSPLSREETSTSEDINAILDTFEGFRFQVTTHIDLTCEEIENKCQEFFQQDLKEFGAVVVIVLTFEGIIRELSARDGRFSESVIFRYLTTDLNPTLNAKPRIYITEANRPVPVEDEGYSVPLDEHPDLLCLHIPTINYGNMEKSPLLILCDNIKSMAGANDLVTILKKAVENIDSLLNNSAEKPVQFGHNLSKDLMLARYV